MAVAVLVLDPKVLLLLVLVLLVVLLEVPQMVMVVDLVLVD